MPRCLSRTGLRRHRNLQFGVVSRRLGAIQAWQLLIRQAQQKSDFPHSFGRSKEQKTPPGPE